VVNGELVELIVPKERDDVTGLRQPGGALVFASAPEASATVRMGTQEPRQLSR
jgi:hypothetical protein